MLPRLLLLLGLVALPLGCAGDDATSDPSGAGAAGDEAKPDDGARPVDLERERGTLRAGDDTLTSGEYADDYTVRAEPGQWIEVAMTSSEFDPYLILRPPSCGSGGGACEAQSDNDDFLTDGGAFVWRQADEDGRWSILATSSQPGETGDYEVRYRVVDDGEMPATAGVTLSGPRTERGQLGPGDQTLNSGEYADSFSFVGRRGDLVTIDLRSTDFDPYVILQMPGDQQADNDDWEGSMERSRVEAELPEDGAYRILVTTYSTGESGSYTLQITPEGRAEGSAAGSGGADSPATETPRGDDPFRKN